MTKPPELAIVIVSYNTKALLGDCLGSVASSRGPSRRVWVVDNASVDGTPEMLDVKYPWVEVIASTENRGYAWANNAGLRAAGFGVGSAAAKRPRYALLLNPDTVLPPEALSTLHGYLEAHPRVGIVGPKLVRRDGSLDKACRRSFPTPLISFLHISGLGKAFPKSRFLGRYNMTFLDPDELAEVDSVVGAFMLIRGQALEDAGLLDEAFFMYGEDLDLAYRIKAAGWRVVYNPAVTVLHIKGASSRQATQRAILAFYDAMRIFHDKHYRASSPFFINWAIDAAVWMLRSLALARDRVRRPERRRVASA